MIWLIVVTEGNEDEAESLHYNNHRYHESLNNVTPADAYFGRDTAIIERKPKSKNALSRNAACSINNTRLNINHR